MKMIERLITIHRDVVGMNNRNIGLISPNNKRVNFKYADDKVLAKEILQANGIATPSTLAVITSMAEIEEVWGRINQQSNIALKPSRGSGGKGIMLLRNIGGSWHQGGKPISEETIHTHIANILFGIYSFGDSDTVLVEELVEPHPFYAEIYAGGLPDFRVITLNDTPVMAMLRMPTARSGGKANLHQGGLGIGIDMQRGLLLQAYDGENYHDMHPDSQAPIAGRTIPLWKEIIDLSVRTAKHFPLKYLGIDIVMDQQKGPMIMEVNVRPGLAIQLANKRGLNSALRSLQNQLS
jgi:alpha-L-glutamate ligase-like protein